MFLLLQRVCLHCLYTSNTLDYSPFPFIWIYFIFVLFFICDIFFLFSYIMIVLVEICCVCTLPSAVTLVYCGWLQFQLNCLHVTFQLQMSTIVKKKRVQLMLFWRFFFLTLFRLQNENTPLLESIKRLVLIRININNYFIVKCTPLIWWHWAYFISAFIVAAFNWITGVPQLNINLPIKGGGQCEKCTFCCCRCCISCIDWGCVTFHMLKLEGIHTRNHVKISISLLCSMFAMFETGNHTQTYHTAYRKMYH